MKYLILVALLFTQTSHAERPWGQLSEEKETAQWLWEKASRFSGLSLQEPTRSLPILVMTEAEMQNAACPSDPQNCRGMVGLYDTSKKRILLRSDMDPVTDMIAASFLLHEMVHALQNQFQNDDELFGTCERLRATEQAAYDAQHAFLKAEGQFFRAGGTMRFFRCDN